MPPKRRLPAQRNPGYAHEALDRAHLISTVFYEFLQDHPFLRAHPHRARRADAIGDRLGELHQAISQAAFAIPEFGDPPPETGRGRKAPARGRRKK